MDIFSNGGCLSQFWRKYIRQDFMGFMNLWFNDSGKIDLFHYWMNQCFWMNLLNKLFKDKCIFLTAPFRQLKKKFKNSNFRNWNSFFTTSIWFLTLSTRFWNWFSIPNPTNGCSAVNGYRQNESPNITIIHTNPVHQITSGEEKSWNKSIMSIAFLTSIHCSAANGAWFVQISLLNQTRWLRKHYYGLWTFRLF